MADDWARGFIAADPFFHDTQQQQQQQQQPAPTHAVGGVTPSAGGGFTLPNGVVVPPNYVPTAEEQEAMMREGADVCRTQ